MRPLVVKGSLLAITFLAAAGFALSQKISKFEDYRVYRIYNGKNARPKFDKNTYYYRTRIREAAKQKRDFAGEYVLAQWGCGSPCLLIVAINVRTGKLYPFPFSISGWTSDRLPLDYRLDSRLISFAGLRNESEKDSRDDLHYYEFRNGRFRFIKTVNRK